MKAGARIIELMSWLFAALIGTRFVLKFFGASTVAPFVQWLYGVTDSLMAPFAGIFPTPSIGVTSLVDIPALVAIAVYLIAGYLISVFIETVDSNLRFRSLRPVTPKPPINMPSTPVPPSTYAQNTAPTEPKKQPEELN